MIMQRLQTELEELSRKRACLDEEHDDSQEWKLLSCRQESLEARPHHHHYEGTGQDSINSAVDGEVVPHYSVTPSLQSIRENPTDHPSDIGSIENDGLQAGPILEVDSW